MKNMKNKINNMHKAQLLELGESPTTKKTTKPPIIVGDKEFKTAKEAIAYTKGYDDGFYNDMHIQESVENIKKSMKCPSDEVETNWAMVALVVLFLGVVSAILFSSGGSNLLTDICL